MLKSWVKMMVISCLLGIGLSHAALGDLPTINTAQGNSVISLNFSAAGTHQQIAIFLINSNDPLGFHLTFTFQNKGVFKSGSRSITPTSLVLNQLSGTLGTNLVPPIDLAITPDGAGVWTWSPGPVLPGTETDSYLVEIAATWPEPAGAIAGFYQEKITCVMTSGF